MRIVESHGQYAAAKGWWIFTSFLDLRISGFWWSRWSPYYSNCWGSIEQVKAALRESSKRKYKTVKKI